MREWYGGDGNYWYRGNEAGSWGESPVSGGNGGGALITNWSGMSGGWTGEFYKDESGKKIKKYYNPHNGKYYYNNKVGKEVWFEDNEVYVKPILKKVYIDNDQSRMKENLNPYNLSGEIRLAMALSSRKLGVFSGLANYPDAISLELNGNARAVAATNTSPVGVLTKTNNNITGPNSQAFFSGSAGLGTVDASASVIVTNYYIIGPNAENVTMDHFTETFFSGDIGFDVGFSIGTGVSYSSPFQGAHIIGISSSVGVGVSPTLISGGLNGGVMDYYSNY